MARVVFTAALFAALAVSAAALSHDHAFIRDPEAALKLDADTVTAGTLRVCMQEKQYVALTCGCPCRFVFFLFRAGERRA